MTKIAVLTLLLIIISCKEKKNNRLNVSVYELSSGQNILRNSYSLIKQTKIIDSIKYEFYKDSINDSSFYFSLYHIDSATLVLLGDTFNKINDKKFKRNNKEFIISKFHKKDIFPENKISFVFYNYKTGLTACFYNSVYRLDYIEYKSTKNLKDIFLKDLSQTLTKK